MYSSASPEAEAFVKEGDTVKKGQVLGIIEAMKLMNEITATQDGEIVDVKISYPADYVKQMLGYSKDYSFLPNIN